MGLIAEIRRRHLVRHESINSIARDLKLCRQTVRRHFRTEAKPSYQRSLQPTPMLGAVQQTLEVWLRSGGYTTIKEFLRTVRPSTPAGYELRLETPPGRQAQVDFAHFRVAFTDQPGSEHVVWLFSMVLGHSRMLWGRFVLHQDLPTLLRCHLAAFDAFGGAPEQILYDRMRTVFSREDPDAGHIVYNRTLVEFARHYGYLPKACKAYRAKTKGKVERPFRYIREDFFLGGSFCSLEDLNVQLRHWLDHIANVRLHATTRRVVAEHFAEEQPKLQPLPAGPFQAVLRLERRVTRDGMVSVDGNLYSVPNTTCRRVVDVQSTANEVRIVEDGRIVAVHPMLEGRGERRIAAGHRTLPPPANSQTQRHAPRGVGGSGDVVTLRPLAFYDAVAKRLASNGALA